MVRDRARAAQGVGRVDRVRDRVPDDRRARRGSARRHRGRLGRRGARHRRGTCRTCAGSCRGEEHGLGETAERDRRVASRAWRCRTTRDEGRASRPRGSARASSRRPRASRRRCCRSSTSRRSSTSWRRRCAPGLTDILIITGRGKRAIEDHFDRNFELEHYLEQSGKHELLAEVQDDQRARRHPLHPPARPARPRARGVGGARARRRRAVRGAARRRHHGRRRARCSARCSTCTTRVRRSVLALLEVAAGRDLVVRLRRSAEPVGDGLVPRAVDRREAAAGGRAVEPRGDRPLRVHARASSTRSTASTPGVGGELQLTDAIGLLLDDRAGVRPRVLRRPLRHRPEARLPARQHRARRSTATRPRPRARRATSSTSCSERGLRSRGADPARRRPGRDPRRGRAAAQPVEVALRDALGLVLAADVVADRAGAAVREHRDGRLRGAGRRHRGRGRRRAGAAAGRRRAAGRARAHGRRSAPGEAIRIMTGAPMPDGADAIVMVERTAARRRRRRARSTRRGRRRATTSARAGGDLEAGERRVRGRARCSAPRTSACSRASARRRCAAYPRARVGVLSTGDELVEDRARSRPGKIRDSNRPMLLALLARRGRRAGRPRHRARRRGRHRRARSSDALDACDAVHHERRRVGRRLRLREGRARPRSATLAVAGPGGDQAGEAALRSACVQRHAGVRAARQPGVVARELRAVRPARAAADDGPRPSRCRPRGRGAAADARDAAAAPTASSTSTACVVDVRATAATSPRERRRRRATRWRPRAAANGLALLPDGDGVDAGDDVTVMLLD